jgi:Rad3-related DNA helicase
VVEAVKLEAFRPSFSSEGVQLPRHSNLMQWAAWADDISGVVEAKAAEARDSYMANKNKESLSRLRRMRRIMQFVGGAKDLDGADDVGTVFRHTDKGVEIRPLWGWHDAKRVLFKRFEHVIIMSATLGDPELLARKLGIEEGEYEVLDLPSPFDLEHRRVWRWPVAKVSARSSEDDYRKLFQAADYIIGRFPQRKGIVHAASHKLAQLFYAESGQQERLLVHGSADKMDVLNTFKTSLQPNVLVTASFTTGLDLPGMLGFQVILKVPFGNLGDDVTRMRKEWGDDGDKFGARNYRAEAMNTVIQAAGRGVRTPTDVCHTFILDANFNMLTRGTYMPQSFDDALTWLDKGAMPSGLGNAS